MKSIILIKDNTDYQLIHKRGKHGSVNPRVVLFSENRRSKLKNVTDSFSYHSPLKKENTEIHNN